MDNVLLFEGLILCSLQPFRTILGPMATKVPTSKSDADPSAAEQLACEALAAGFGKKHAKATKVILPGPLALACDMDQPYLRAQL